MPDFLYTLSDVQLLVFLTTVTVLISLVSIFLVRRFVPSHILYKDNEMLGSISALVGVIYGVLAGLMALYLLNNINIASDAVLKEASAVANIYRDTIWLDDPLRTNIQEIVEKYLNQVINVEWPEMSKNKGVSSEGDTIIVNFDDAIITASKTAPQLSLIILRDLLSEVKSLYDARQQRIQLSYSSLEVEIWVVIILGTILTLGINYLFGMNIYLHVISVSAASMMVSAIIFLMITLDRPYQGEFAIDPGPFVSILKQVEAHKHHNDELPKGMAQLNRARSNLLSTILKAIH